MRIIGEVPHPECKITLLNWNNRYLVKLEKGFLEQTYKISQFDLTGDADLFEVVNETFIRNALNQFDAMEATWNQALQHL